MRECAPRTPAARARGAFSRNPAAMTGLVLFAVLLVAAILAPFLAPYAEGELDRDRFLHPPTVLHWRDARGTWHPRPFVWATVPADPELLTYREDHARPLPLRFFVRGARYRFLGLVPADRHLFGVDAPGRVYLLGADGLGRDVWTRLLYGAQVSLSVGLIGIALSFTFGLLLGGIAGYWGGWADTLVMRSTEVLLSIPSLYLLMALRGALPRDLPSREVYLAIVALLSLVGWAGLARVVRGMVLSLRTREYVLAAEALGMSRVRVLLRHILPNTASFVVVAATLAVPAYILGEVFLSFLGLGVQDPSASWGNMLNQARSLAVMRGQPWLLFAPATAIFVTVMAFNLLGDGLRDALDPRASGGAR